MSTENNNITENNEEDAEDRNARKYCSMCGKRFNMWDLQNNFVIHKYRICYGSVHDEMGLCLELCNECMDKIIQTCEISPVTDEPFVNYREGSCETYKDCRECDRYYTSRCDKYGD